MSDLHQDRLFWGDIEECYYYDRKTGASKSRVIKKDALLYNSGDFYIDIESMNWFNTIQILLGTVPEDSLLRMPLFPQFIYRNLLCPWGGTVQGFFLGHRFIREETLREAYPYHKDQSYFVKERIHKKYYL